MTQERPDTDEKNEPGGTPWPGQGGRAAEPVSPGTDDAGSATAVPGAYDAYDAAQERGEAVEPGH